MNAPAKPRPIISVADRPYWEFLRKHELRMQCCARCEALRFPASPICPECSADKFEWQPLSGHGEVFSWVVFHKSYFPSFDAELPYNVAMIQLAEGPMFIANLVDIENDAIRKGLAVDVVFDDDTFPDLTIPRFRPSKPDHAG